MADRGSLDPNIFRAYDIRGTVGEQITPEVIRLIARGFGTMLAQGKRATVVVGRDLRAAAQELSAAVVGGLRRAGCDVLDIGEAPTPLVYFAIGHWDCDGGVGITASHKPVAFNGLKLRRREYPFYGDDIAALFRFLNAGQFADGNGSYQQRDVYADYFEVCARKFDGDCDLRIYLDLGNGCGVFNAQRLLEMTGCSVDTLYAQPDGSFPNRSPDPMEPGALDTAAAAVASGDYDLGMAIDADGDRLAVLDDHGALVSPDRYVLPMCAHLMAGAPSTFVSEVRCSRTALDFVRQRGGDISLAACGYPFILAEMSRVSAPLGFETTGHIFFDDPDIKFDDAAFCAANLAVALSHQDLTLREMLEQAPRYYTSPEQRLACPDEVKHTVVADVIEVFRPDHEMNTVDGARIEFEGGWGLIRASNTGEELVMRFEARTSEECDAIADQVLAAVADAMAAHGVAMA